MVSMCSFQCYEERFVKNYGIDVNIGCEVIVQEKGNVFIIIIVIIIGK